MDEEDADAERSENESEADEAIDQVSNLTEIARELREMAGVIVDLDRRPDDEGLPTVH